MVKKKVAPTDLNGTFKYEVIVRILDGKKLRERYPNFALNYANIEDFADALVEGSRYMSNEMSELLHGYRVDVQLVSTYLVEVSTPSESPK